MARVDRDRACYLQANYGKAWDEEDSYDCVFNTGSLTYDQVVELLVEELAVKESLATPEAKAHLADLALAHRLKARLATHPKVLAPTLNVSPGGRRHCGCRGHTHPPGAAPGAGNRPGGRGGEAGSL